MSYNLFIDDERFPSDKDLEQFVIARSSAECITMMELYGCPEFISFDHDLGGKDTSIIVINWMIARDLDQISDGSFFIPENFSFTVHSQNPVGAKNIEQLLNRYLRFRSDNGNICI